MRSIEFNQLVTSNAEFLRVFAFALTRDNDAAKDLLQETFYKVLANRDKFNDGTNVKAWMYTVMRNIFINDYRRKGRQHIIFDHSPNDYLLNYSQASVKNNAEVSLNLKDIRRALHNLPGIFKQPFEMYFDGYKYNEIAHVLQEPLGTVKSRIHFARKLLKNRLQDFK